MRSLALGQAWRARGGTVSLLGCCDSDALWQRVASAGVTAIPLERPFPDPADLQTTLAVLSRLPDSTRTWLVLDGYHLGPEYQRGVRAAGNRLLVIDDEAHLPEYHVDVILNQNLGAERFRYRCNIGTRFLLGPRYALLRPEFAERHGRRQAKPLAKRVLVTLGGSDPANVTLLVIRALQEFHRPDLEAAVVVGPANPHGQTLKEAVGRPNGPIRLVTSTTDMAGLMEWADVAVSAGGTTCWELAALGVPSILVVIADNQRSVAAALDAAGVAHLLGPVAGLDIHVLARALGDLLADADRRRGMAERGARLVDGSGARRVAAVLAGGEP